MATTPPGGSTQASGHARHTEKTCRENITQAICRDLLAFALQNLRSYRIVAHVHDEVILEVPQDTSLDEVCEIMGRTPDWIPGLELRADGFEGLFYRK